MSTNPTHCYLIEHADTLYRMRDEMTGLEPRLTRDLCRAVASLAKRRKLDCVEGLCGDGVPFAEGEDSIDLTAGIYLKVFDEELRLPSTESTDVVAVTFFGDLEALLRGAAEEFVRIDMSLLSVHLDDLDVAKELWLSAGLEELFAGYSGWRTYTNNRVPHTFWGARVPDAPSPDLADLARAWDTGRLEDALGFVDEALDVYQSFASVWKKSITPRLEDSRCRRSA